MSTFWKNGSKQCKDLGFGTLEPQNCVNLLRGPSYVLQTKKFGKHLNTYLECKVYTQKFWDVKI